MATAKDFGKISPIKSVTSVIATSTDYKFAARITPNFHGKPDVGKHNYKNMLCICWLDPNT